MGKKILKIISFIFENTVVKVCLYLAAIMLIFQFYGIFDQEGLSWQTVGMRLLELFTDKETLAVFMAAIVSIALAKLIMWCNAFLEESKKLEDNHHKIISVYNGHEKSMSKMTADQVANYKMEENMYDKKGQFMFLFRRHIQAFHPNELRNTVKDPYSKKYTDVQTDIDTFKRGALYLPTLNVFANVKGDTQLVFRDSDELYQLPDFVMSNARNLLAAHKNSKRTNNSTVRLKDVDYRDGKLELATQRSMYFHMLITNRCMDYQFDDGLTIRTVYEYNNTISPLDQSVLGNQIGINGLILSRDGYVLIEKRDHTKITWKNKFAQSISLAMKVNDLKLKDTTIASDPQTAETIFKRIIEKTVMDNFGLTPKDYETFTVQENFLGFARDLLEGGKPNLYFYIVTKYDAAQLAQLLAKNAAWNQPAQKTGDPKPLQTDKLRSDYYLVPFEDLKVNFEYKMKVDRRRSAYWIRRHVHPRVSRRAHMAETVRHWAGRTFEPVICRECGEALLVTLAYLEICQDRIQAIRNKEEE